MQQGTNGTEPPESIEGVISGKCDTKWNPARQQHLAVHHNVRMHILAQEASGGGTPQPVQPSSE
ncbi:hypothetical protein PCASD_05927 [Puccinia coronata f. sp. avenae]|uniref:Uncharacterized protein n=1 Tax=Puccinia coronata f. sp. avenae TaxID=200324 RepID=A0A2N5SKE1_9BASI|nr:hypothetical protein PCASD_21320 [Puccinia coronata f. sp. avenae]PLW45474.1 hypothetical protein PCASD_05927 [Puccinia coronata f. sp. avenae]